MKPYLIQRAKFHYRQDKKGIDTILKFDYMGSSEFEFGALPKSLQRIRDVISEYVYFEINLNGKSITVFCKENKKDFINQYLTDLSLKNFTLKEYSDFDNYIYDGGFFKCNTDFWWDIENDVMFWKKNQDFLNEFEKIIVAKPISI